MMINFDISRSYDLRHSKNDIPKWRLWNFGRTCAPTTNSSARTLIFNFGMKKVPSLLIIINSIIFPLTKKVVLSSTKVSCPYDLYSIYCSAPKLEIANIQKWEIWNFENYKNSECRFEKNPFAGWNKYAKYCMEQFEIFLCT